MDDPLEFVDFADVLQHGDPGNWKFKGEKAGSPAPGDVSAQRNLGR